VAGTEIKGCGWLEVCTPLPPPCPSPRASPFSQKWRKCRIQVLRSQETASLPWNSDYLIKWCNDDVIVTSAKYFDAISLVVTRSHSWSLVVTRGHLWSLVVYSWSLVVTRGHSWSLVVTRGLLMVTRGHSWSLVVTHGHLWSLVVTRVYF